MLHCEEKLRKNYLLLDLIPTLMYRYPLYYHPPPSGGVLNCRIQYSCKQMRSSEYRTACNISAGGMSARSPYGPCGMKSVLAEIKIEQLISAEVKRISEALGKSFLDCDDIAELSGLGRDNARILMKSKAFPLITVGRRQVVSILAFVTWQVKDYLTGEVSNGYKNNR